MKVGLIYVVLAATVSALLSGGAVWASTVGRLVTRDDVSKMIAIESPYIADRGTIGTRLDSIDARLGRIETKLDVH